MPWKIDDHDVLLSSLRCFGCVASHNRELNIRQNPLYFSIYFTFTLFFAFIVTFLVGDFPAQGGGGVEHLHSVSVQRPDRGAAGARGLAVDRVLAKSQPWRQHPQVRGCCDCPGVIYVVLVVVLLFVLLFGYTLKLVTREIPSTIAVSLIISPFLTNLRS